MLMNCCRICRLQWEAETTSNKVVVVDGKDIVVDVSPIISDDRYTGNIITLKSFEETEEKQHGIRAQIARAGHGARYTFGDIVGLSSQIQECVKVAVRMAKSDSSVLIMGESGTGKESFAQSIHNGSDRSKRNFVALNCAAIPEHLLESELFGYEEGAFTGARKGGKIGYFELAHQGTIFLDEIGEMPLTLQSKLLRVLEEKTVTRIGASKLIDVDVRIIAATNKKLAGAGRSEGISRGLVLPNQRFAAVYTASSRANRRPAASDEHFYGLHGEKR